MVLFVLMEPRVPFLLSLSIPIKLTILVALLNSDQLPLLIKVLGLLLLFLILIRIF
jgi:hypothetical protein